MHHAGDQTAQERAFVHVTVYHCLAERADCHCLEILRRAGCLFHCLKLLGVLGLDAAAGAAGIEAGDLVVGVLCLNDQFLVLRRDLAFLCCEEPCAQLYTLGTQHKGCGDASAGGRYRRQQ